MCITSLHIFICHYFLFKENIFINIIIYEYLITNNITNNINLNYFFLETV